MTRALVIGAGIGGLTAGRALRRAGYDVSIFERAASLDHVQAGGAIHLWHNGMRGLQRLELANGVEALGGDAARVATAEMRNHHGRLLTRWSVADTEREVGAPTLGVCRPDLHRVLTAGVEPGMLELGRELTSYRVQAGGVVAQFADGGEETGDVLIGADGLKSAVRRTLLGDAPLRFARYSSWQALCDYEDAAAAPVGLFWIVWGPGARFLFYHVGPGKLYWEGIFATAEGGTDPPGGRRAAVAERFAGWAHPVPAIIAATAEPAIMRHDVYDRPATERWGDGPVTLLGDAVHPMTNAAGQGANQTIEDAVVLGSRLTGAPDVPAALRVYESERRKRSAGIAALAWRLTSMSRWSSPAAVVARDRLITAMMVIGKRQQRKDMGYEF